jgi:hypothetical protein
MTAGLDDAAPEEPAATAWAISFGPAAVSHDDGRNVRIGLIGRHPTLVAQCRGVADVITAVRFARERDEHARHRSGRER